MRALSLWQPWATLVAIGAKRIETRHWHAPSSLIGETLVIHASKTTEMTPMARRDPFASALGNRDLPLGAIVGTARLVSCARIDRNLVDEIRDEHGAQEVAFGNYETGRCAWILADPVALTVPIPWKGSQGIFTVPDSVLAGIGVHDGQERLL